MLILATAATIIASQAIISGSFSLISQAISLGFCPPLRVIPTSRTIAGQIYVPSINSLLMALSVAITFGFGTAATISNAYGLQISLISVITSVLFMLLLRYAWNLNLLLVLPFAVFLLVDLLFLFANAQKVPKGGWVAILIAGVIFLFLICWWYGEHRLAKWRKRYARVLPLTELPLRVRRAAAAAGASVPPRPRIAPPGGEHSSHSSSGNVKPAIASVPTESISAMVARHSIDFDLGTIGSVLAGLVPASVVFLSSSLTHTPFHFETWLQHIHAMPDTLLFLVTDVSLAYCHCIRRPSVPSDASR